MGQILLYEGNDATQNWLVTYSDRWGRTYRVHPDDEARSAVLEDVKAGTKIELFDDSGGSERKGWVEIVVKIPTARYVVGTFEKNIPDGDNQYVTMRFNGKKLDGKVSRIEIGSVGGPD